MMFPANQDGAGTRHCGRDHGSFIAFIKRGIERRRRAHFFRYRRNSLLRSLAFAAAFHTRCMVRIIGITVCFDRIDKLWCAD